MFVIAFWRKYYNNCHGLKCNFCHYTVEKGQQSSWPPCSLVLHQIMCHHWVIFSSRTTWLLTGMDLDWHDSGLAWIWTGMDLDWHGSGLAWLESAWSWLDTIHYRLSSIGLEAELGWGVSRQVVDAPTETAAVWTALKIKSLSIKVKYF